MKRPSFQFYPADWRKDTALQFCSLAAQGLWINAMCMAHECEPYGHLTVNGRPMNSAQIGRMVGINGKECDKLLSELIDAGVCSKADDGSVYSRRMVRDEDVRNRRANGGAAGAEHGAKGASFGAQGGRPRKHQGGIQNPPSAGTRGVSEPPSKPPPSSSSSSSSSKNPLTPKGAVCSPGFARFWAAWPAHPRKSARLQCWNKWKARDLDPLTDQIVAHVEAMKTSEQWRKDGGEYIPAPLTYLNQQRFEAPTEAQAVAAAESTNWRESWKTIAKKGAELGCGVWTPELFQDGKAPNILAYTKKVEAAVKKAEQDDEVPA